MSEKRKQFRRRQESSSSSSSNDEAESDGANPENKQDIKEKIEELKLLQKQRERKHGIDVYSLAIGEQDTSSYATSSNTDNDPWKSRTGGLVDMKRLKEKRGIEIVKNMNSNFAKETNQRDEDAEMQKFIEEQLRIKKDQEAKNKESDPSSSQPSNELLVSQPIVAKFKRPEDALFDVPRYLIENTSKHKSEETLSEQMLSGIPEVDLGVDERIRNIEETERAKQRIVNQKKTTQSGHNMSNQFGQQQQQQQQQLGRQNSDNSQYAPQNTSVNFVQHKRFDDALINPDHMIKPRINRPNTVNTAQQVPQPVVGDAPKHELLQQANQTNYTTGYSIKSKFNRNNNVPNQNARRQYFVSTNMNEKEPDDLELAVSSGINADAAALTAEDVAAAAATAVASAASTSNAEAVSGDKASGTAKKSHKRHHHHHHHNNKNNTGQPNEKASDDYCLERFKKNMRFSRNSKIKIC